MLIFLIIVFVVIIFTALLIADFRLGKKKDKIQTPVFEFGKLRGDYYLFTTGHALFDSLFQDIREARSHIDILFFIVKTDEISKELLTLLKQKALEGVTVRLFVDRMGGFGLTKRVIQDLRANGVSFAFSNKPSLPFFFYKLNKRNHRKIAVIDDEAGYIGGFNVGKEYLGRDTELGVWHDYHLKITGKAVQSLTTVFKHDWNTAGNSYEQSHDRKTVSALGNNMLELIPTENGQLEQTLIKRISIAKDEILIGTPYFIPSKRLYNELLNALQRNVTINLIVPMKSDHLFVKEAGIPYYHSLSQAGANVYLFDSGFYHAKVMMIDQKLCDIGTANFDMRSLFLNKEISVVIREDANFIHTVRESYLKDMYESLPLNDEWITQRSIQSKVMGIIARWIKPLL